MIFPLGEGVVDVVEMIDEGRRKVMQTKRHQKRMCTCTVVDGRELNESMMRQRHIDCLNGG